MSDERISARGDAVRTKYEFNMEETTPEMVELIRELREVDMPWSVEFEEPPTEVISETDFSLLEWKLEKGGFDPQEDADFIQNARELSVMADVASTKLKSRSLVAHSELKSFQVKLKGWFVRTLYAHVHSDADTPFYEVVNRELPAFIEEQQHTLMRLRLDSESVWGLIWLLTSKCKVKWHKDGERPPVL